MSNAVCDRDAVTVPAPLVAAVAQPGTGQIAIVLGAGCSMDAPTNLASASDYAKRAYRDLVEQRIIVDGCCDREDLGALADAVFAITGSQEALVDILRRQLANASPNDGHKIAASLLAEGIVGLILTLNFDRALDTAISDIATEAYVAIIHGVEDLRARTRQGLVYLHGNVESPDSRWILRTAQIDANWEDTWQEYILTDFALTPNVIFAGLGSPTPVISETVLKVRGVLVPPRNVFQVDALDRGDNRLADALEIPLGDYIRSCWTGFMGALGGSASRGFLNAISDRHPTFCEENRLHREDITLVMESLPMDILILGKLRAAWFMSKAEYKTFINTMLDHLVDIVRALAIALRIVQANECVVVEDGMEFRKDGKPLFRVFSCSGAGSMFWARAEAEIRSRLRKFRRIDKTTPVVYLTTAVLDMDKPTSVPESIVPKPEQKEVTASPPDFACFSPSALLAGPDALRQMVRS